MLQVAPCFRLKRKGLLRMSFGSLASLVYTIYLCRRLKKKLVTVPAVKHEQFSDIELWPVSHQSKGKAPAHPESPVIVSSDESGSDMFSDTPKAKGRNHGTTATVDSVKEGLLSPTASGGEQDTGVADATPRCVCLND